jgi:hypothetical protein
MPRYFYNLMVVVRQEKQKSGKATPAACRLPPAACMSG